MTVLDSDVPPGDNHDQVVTNTPPRSDAKQHAIRSSETNGSTSNHDPPSVVSDSGIDSSQAEIQQFEQLVRASKDLRMKREADASKALHVVKEAEFNGVQLKLHVSEESQNALSSNAAPTVVHVPSKLPARVPVISGPQQGKHNSNLHVTGERMHIVASKKEESPDINLHSIPLFSPRPVQPKPAVIADPFVPVRPARRRYESDINHRSRNLTIETEKANLPSPLVSPIPRPAIGPRTTSSPNQVRSPGLSSGVDSKTVTLKPLPLPRSDRVNPQTPRNVNGTVPSPVPTTTIPLPPLSLPTYLQLELSSHRPPQSLIYRSASSDFPYESSRVKIERLLNFLFLPHQLEAVLWFGALACLDYWLYTFTILPLRLLKSLYILAKSLIHRFTAETRYVGRFVYRGSQRMWHRRGSRAASKIRKQMSRANSESKFIEAKSARGRSRSTRHYKTTKSVPSALLPDDKADLLKGLLIIFTCLILLRLDASRMYHWVRGQAAIKLYVIYNVLEVCDRLLSAIGQDVLECLFSQEALERKPDGHSKILRPFWLFVLALGYTVTHSVALFYQVITLNVAVNSYSNALVTLLMSNQFVEIKGTVFKKFEKDNLFQLTCADIVERFQLWHMLLIIASRNIIETGGLNFGSSGLSHASAVTAASGFTANATHTLPWSVSSILPSSFTLLSSWTNSLSSYVPTISQILSPFFIVLGSEMLIDWLKHAYIGKFNNVRPIVYGRFLDILAKDYYTNAFGDQNLTKRLGLPVIPLSCLLIRAGVQLYQMSVAAWMPPSQSNTAASLASIHQQYTASRNAMPTSTAAILASKMDVYLYHIPSSIANSEIPSNFTTVLVLLSIYLMLLVCKLILGMILLAYSRARFNAMLEREREREKNAGHHVEGGRRVGGWGVVEVDEDKRRWIYDDDPARLQALRDREAREQTKREQAREKGGGGTEGLDKVKRYEMVAKRIW